MSKQFKNFLIKTLILSTFMVLTFNIGENLINANTGVKTDTITKNENYSNFKKINNSSLGKTGVAITTNIGIRYKQRQETPATIYKEIFSINEIVGDTKNANNELIGSNMLVIEEYRNVLKTNIKQLLETSLDKPRLLNSFIEQLEFRYTLAVENLKKLNEQKTIFETTMNSANTDIETLKQKIENDFKLNDSGASLENINNYLELKQKYYYARTYIVYINHFISEYESLNNFNKILLDTLINNKDALIKGSFVVLPDSGTDLLRNFDLLYDEAEFKNQ